MHKENFNPNSLDNLMDVYLAMLKSEEATDSFSGKMIKIYFEKLESNFKIFFIFLRKAIVGYLR